MQRREFIASLGGAAAASILSVRAQSANKISRIGLLDYAANEAGRLRLWGAFRQRMHELGYTEGDTIIFEPRWAEGNVDRARALAAELINLPVDVIAAAATHATLAAKHATDTIPIVMTGVGDPVRLGLVASLNRPGGNVTGLTLLLGDLMAKRLELLRQIVPEASRVAILWDSSFETAETAVPNTESAARALGISLQLLAVRSADEFEGAFASMVRDRTAAVLVGGSPVFFAERARLIDLAAKHGLPAVFNEKTYVAAGGLMSYGTEFAESFRRAADYVDKILKGAKPADLPVEQPTKFDLAINLKTAKALGLDLSPTLLAQADEVIE